MSRRTRRHPGRFAAAAAIVALVGLLVAWAALRAAAIRTLPPETPLLATIAPDNPDGVLTEAEVTAATGRGTLDDAVFARIGRAAQRLPLDDRAFFMFALPALARGHDAHALQLLEEARARNPRNRFARLLLMDRYLRRGDTAAASSEMTVLARLLPASGAVLSGELARLAANPLTAEPVRRALRPDPNLLNQVLVAMVRNGVAPATIVRFAGRGAPAGLDQEGWRRALIDARIAAGDFAGARALWAQSYRVPAAEAAAVVYDAGFVGRPGPPPFNWSTAGSDIGSATIGGGALAIQFYGRRSGELAAQLLTLPPGAYALRFAVDGMEGGDGSGVAWTVSCAGRDGAPLVSTPTLPVSPTARQVVARFTVPAQGCAGQWLRLSGTAGEFASPTQARIRALSIGPAA